MSHPKELYSLLIPLREERLLVPRMCVAEVIAFADTDRSKAADAPEWLLGTVDWNNRRVPVISLDSAGAHEARPSGRKGSRSRIVIFHAITGALKTGFYGVLTQGFPQLVRVNRDVLGLESDMPLPADQPMLCRLRMIHEFPLVPDVEQIERRLAGLATAA